MIAVGKLYRRNKGNQGMILLWKGPRRLGTRGKGKLQAEGLKQGVKMPPKTKRQYGRRGSSEPRSRWDSGGTWNGRKWEQQIKERTYSRRTRPRTGTLDREEMSELSDLSIEKPAVGGSPTDNTKTRGVTEKTATSSSFSGRGKKKFWEIFPVYNGNRNWRWSRHWTRE